MKSLVESLFDKDITTQDLPYEKLLKSHITIKDINHVVFNSEGFHAQSGNTPLPIKNKFLQKWSEKWFDDIKPGRVPVFYCRYGAYSPWSEDKEKNKEGENYLKLNKIHTSVHFNDAMYANSFDIAWNTWGPENEWDNITEWIVWKCKITHMDQLMILINRKDFNELDQQVIHKLIEIINKKGSK